MSGAGINRSAELFLEHHDRLRRFARQLVRTNSDADDLVQKAFLKAHRYMCNGNTIRAPVAFLFATVRNLVSDQYRQEKIPLTDSPIDVDDIVLEGEAQSVEQQVVTDREFEELCAAITQLPERMCQVFVLRKVYGYSCREIAERLGLSANTVRELVARSFKRLQAQRMSHE